MGLVGTTSNRLGLFRDVEGRLFRCHFYTKSFGVDIIALIEGQIGCIRNIYNIWNL
jgi:hypothetical protein